MRDALEEEVLSLLSRGVDYGAAAGRAILGFGTDRRLARRVGGARAGGRFET